MKQKELDKIIALHEKWVVDNHDGKRADLSGADLFRSDLSDAILFDANLSNADLRGADLSGADLRDVNLSDADLSFANLSETTLNWVNWHEAKGIDVYVAGLQSSRYNAQLTYIPSLDVATTGCWQNTWEATKKRVKDVYKKNDSKIYRKYQLAFQYIEAQMIEDNQ